MTLRLTSLQNPKVKVALRLRERKGRDETGLMLVEGYDELRLALAAGLRPHELFFCPELAGSQELPLLAQLRGAGSAVIEVSEAVMAKLAYRQHPGAWLAAAVAPRRRLGDLMLPPVPLLLVAEAVEKPGNLGAILRSADAAGVDGVIVCDRRTDLFNPNVLRASKGTVFSVPVASATSEETLTWLKERGIRIAAATPAAAATLWDADLAGPLTIAVGTEKEGLSDRWLGAADIQVAIPMAGRADSLNVAQAATLLIFEALRQRRGRN